MHFIKFRVQGHDLDLTFEDVNDISGDLFQRYDARGYIIEILNFLSEHKPENFKGYPYDSCVQGVDTLTIHATLASLEAYTFTREELCSELKQFRTRLAECNHSLLDTIVPHV